MEFKKYLHTPFNKMFKRILQKTFICLTMISSGCDNLSEEASTGFDQYPIYSGQDLGLTGTVGGWQIKIWVPTAETISLKIYDKGLGGELIETIPMERSGQGVWIKELSMEYSGLYYTFQVTIEGELLEETVDPYVKLVGVNGRRGFFGDPEKGDPEGWNNDNGPTVENPTDIVLYELHVRDLSMDPSSGMKYNGKFLAFAEENTSTSEGIKTGLSHLKELGVTHIHLLPSFDYRSIDETRLDDNKFNWGYDPQNYNVPEGSYSTDPYDPMSRVSEMKKLVKTLHDNGFGVILDVVYNHTGFTNESVFNQLVPKYYYRLKDDGSFSDASACGNETASERYMMRKFMIESMKYWVDEYHMDGFRVDLMGIHDIETMNEISRELKSINPSIFIYGEGWTASSSPLPDSLRALKANASELDGIAVFSDELRDGIKGHWSDKEDKGFVSGKLETKESVKFGIAGATRHPQVDYTKVNYTNIPWSNSPSQTITYVSCHDDLTLWDKLAISNPDASRNDLIQMHKLANTIVMTSQGIPFLHGGVDFLRSKNGDHNSFESSDSINSIKWDQKEINKSVFEYYQKLIRLRKEHAAFRIPDAQTMQENLSFIQIEDELVIGYELGPNANGDVWNRIIIYFNGNESSVNVELPEGEWVSVLENGEIDLEGIGTYESRGVQIPGRSALIVHN